MKVGEKVLFSDENGKTFPAVIVEVRVDSTIDLKVSRTRGIPQIYCAVPTKDDARNNIWYDEEKKQKTPTLPAAKEKLKSVFTKKKE